MRQSDTLTHRVHVHGDSSVVLRQEGFFDADHLRSLTRALSPASNCTGLCLMPKFPHCL